MLFPRKRMIKRGVYKKNRSSCGSRHLDKNRNARRSFIVGRNRSCNLTVKRRLVRLIGVLPEFNVANKILSIHFHPNAPTEMFVPVDGNLQNASGEKSFAVYVA